MTTLKISKPLHRIIIKINDTIPPGYISDFRLIDTLLYFTNSQKLYFVVLDTTADTLFAKSFDSLKINTFHYHYTICGDKLYVNVYTKVLIYRLFPEKLTAIKIGEISGTELGLDTIHTYFITDKNVITDSFFVYHTFRDDTTQPNIYKIFVYNINKKKVTDSIFFNLKVKSGSLFFMHWKIYKSCLYVSDRLNPFLYVYDLNTKELDTIFAKSMLIDTVPNSESFDEFETQRYSGIYIDPFNEVVFRDYMIYKKIFYVGSILIKNGREIGEFLDSTKTIPRLIFLNKNRALVYNWHESKLNQSIILDLVSYKYVKVNKGEWLKKWREFKKQVDMETEACKIYTDIQIDKAKLSHYLSLYHVAHEDSIMYLIVPYHRSCPSCVDDALSFVNMNYNALRRKNFKVLMIMRKSEAIKAPAFYYDSLFTYFDSTGRYYDLHITKSYNPTLVVMKDGKVSFARVYNPNALDSLQFRVLEFLGVKF